MPSRTAEEIRRGAAMSEPCPACSGEMQRRDGMGTPWKCTACGFRVHQGYLDKLRATAAAREAEAVRAYLVKLQGWQHQAASLVSTLNAYDGQGIPGSDARDAFKFLREMRDTGLDIYSNGLSDTPIKVNARALLGSTAKEG